MSRFSFFSLSDIGRVRIRNEDAWGAIDPLDSSTLRNSDLLYVVADRMGGHEQGEQASTFDVQSRLCVYDQAPQVPTGKRLREIYLQFNKSPLDYTRVAELARVSIMTQEETDQLKNRSIFSRGEGEILVIREISAPACEQEQGIPAQSAAVS
jgi:serine/threonine protein phosphatase PrpC